MAFTPSHLVFLIIALLTLVCGVGVVTSRNMFHAALWLVGALFGVAAVFATLEAGFLAIAQILVYIGAIATLIVFAIMLSRGMLMGKTRMSNFQWGISAVVAIALFILLGIILFQVNWPVVQNAVPSTTVEDIGKALVDVNGYVVPFEVVSVLLLVALVGAIMIARER